MSHDSSAAGQSAHVRVGQFALLLGFCGLALLIFGSAGALPEALSWRVRPNAPALAVVSVLLMVAGVSLLWRGRSPAVDWAPSKPGRRFSTLLVYTRVDCGLCDEAVEKLGSYSEWLPPLEEVDLDECGDDMLQARYDRHVPVVEIDGRVRFRGRVNELLLQRLIDGTPPQPVLRQR